MKRILFPFICLLIIQVASAQKNALAFDENNKYISYQIVQMPGTKADSLGEKALGFIKENYPKTKFIQSGDTSITIKGKFITYSALAFAKHEGGAVSYTLTIECKDNKYRYWLTDFVYTPYERDRYGVFVPVNGHDVELEKALSKLDKKEFDSCLEQTGAFCNQTGDRLKAYMLQQHKVSKSEKVTVKKIVTDKW
jgi:hypothetical protein